MMLSRLGFLLSVFIVSSTFASHSFATAYCNPSDIPSSLVVTQISTSSSCASGYTYNAVPPVDGQYICSTGSQNLAALGFVKTWGWSSLQCGDSTFIDTNQYTINVARDGLWVCESQVPNGFSVIETRQSNQCTGRKTNQIFQYRIAGSGSVSGTFGDLQHIGGLCVHPKGGSATPANNTPAILFNSCAPETRLQYRLLSNGSIQHVSSGMCLHPQGGSSNPANGTGLVFYTGCGEARTKFEFTAGGSLRHVASGKCIHPQGGSATPANETPLIFFAACDEARLKFKFLP